MPNGLWTFDLRFMRTQIGTMKHTAMSNKPTTQHGMMMTRLDCEQSLSIHSQVHSHSHESVCVVDGIQDVMDWPA